MGADASDYSQLGVNQTVSIRKRLTPWCPHHHHHASCEKADRLEAWFAVIAPRVLDPSIRAPQKPLRHRRNQAPRSASVASRFAGSKVIFTYF